MEKIIFQQRIMEKTSNKEKTYKIKVTPKDNGYQARTTLDLGGVLKKNPRPECYSTVSPKEAITRLVDKMQIILSNYTKKRIKILGIEEPDTVYYTFEDVEIAPKVTFKPVNTPKQEIIIPNMKVSSYIPTDDFTANPEMTYSPKECAFIWFNYLLDRTKKQPEDENYLNMKTVESYIGVLRRVIIPYFEEYRNIKDLEEDHIKNMLSTINGSTQKKSVLTVTKLFFSFLKENKYIKYNITLEIKLPRKKKVLNEIDFIEEEDREKWIHNLLEEKTDITNLFLTMLLSSARPEEACGLKWKALDFERDDIHICNAYKDFEIYNEFMEVIGHERKDDILKTPESYRHIHMDPILKKMLITHKLKQQELFKRLHKQWSENEYVFLNVYHRPFVSDNLSKNMPKFLARHTELEHLTVYGLRHSFATHCRELGMKPEVLAKIMGHTEYETTQKYYVHIPRKTKVDELKKVQDEERKNFKSLKIEDITELDNYTNQSFEDFSINGIEINSNDKIKSTFLESA